MITEETMLPSAGMQGAEDVSMTVSVRISEAPTENAATEKVA